MLRSTRLKKELEILSSQLPAGITCCPKDDALNQYEAVISGTPGTPYEGGKFKLTINIPERYPFEPPRARFETQIYHPNIDTAGRICLSVLQMPPKGGWKPSLNIKAVILSIQQLMNEPNLDDPLMVDIVSDQFHKIWHN